MTETVRLAVAQPRVVMGARAEENVARAVELTARAAASGADLVLFPEHYPGPPRPTVSYDATERMSDAAGSNGIAVCWSRMERCADGLWRLAVYVEDSSGGRVTRYERSHPATLPPSETNAWVAPGEELCTFELGGVVFGIAVCSELWVPEPARVLAIRGAEVILSPAGGGFTTLTENWQIMARARAIENLCYVGLTNNIYGEEMGAAMITGPEHVVSSSGTEDLVVANLDLERARWLRDRDDSLADPKPFSSIPGLVRARRPELYGELVDASSSLFDYHQGPSDPGAVIE